MDIVLDTNIYEANFSLTSARWEALAAYLHKTNDHLIIPYVVHQEVIAHYKEDLKAAVKGLKQSASVLGEVAILPEHRELIAKIAAIRNRDAAWLDEQGGNYLKHLQTRLGSVKLVDLPKLDIKPILDRALRKESPFKENGVGLKDTALWESVLHYAQAEKSNPIVFISNNSNDFGKGKLFEHLQKEAESRNVSIFYYNSLEDFIKEHFDTIKDISIEAKHIDLIELQDLMETRLKGTFQEADRLFKAHSTGNRHYHSVQGIHNTVIKNIEEVIVKDVSPEFKYVHATLVCDTAVVCVADHYSEYTNRFGDHDYDAYQELDEINTECLVNITMKLSENDTLFDELEITEITFP
jgi:hypothetical protein